MIQIEPTEGNFVGAKQIKDFGRGNMKVTGAVSICVGRCVGVIAKAFSHICPCFA
jgi:hypothetical protein